MSETRKLAAILCSDVVGYSRLAGADEDRILARLRALRSDLIDPTIAVHHGRVVKRTGDGSIIEFRSVVDAVRCAIEVQHAMIERNAGVPEDRRIIFRIGIHLGDVVEESDGDLMGDGVNIAARLEGIAKPGAICLSEDAYRQVKGRLDLAVTDLGPTQLKNIAEPVRAYSVEVGVPAAAKPTPAARWWQLTKVALVASVAVVLIAVTGGAWRFLGPGRPAADAALVLTPPTRLSIVVLPFSNLSGDASQDYLADALVDELTTYVSRIPDTFVIARNSAFTYKGKSIDIKQIGKELGVRYALEGSVQPTPSRIRVNAQLIDAETGAHLWAETFDEERADLLQMEDDIVTRLARSLDVQMTAVEAAKAGRSRPNNPDARELSLQCWAAFMAHPPLATDTRKYASLYESCDRTLDIDPLNLVALDVLINRQAWRAVAYRDAEFEAETSRLEGLTTRALTNEPDSNHAHHIKLYMDFIRSKFQDAFLESERALALNPADMDAYIGLVANSYKIGQAGKSIEYADKAMRLSPKDPFFFGMILNKAIALLVLERYGEALPLLERFLKSVPTNQLALRIHIFALEALGREREAHEAYLSSAALPGKKIESVAQYRAFINLANQTDDPAYGAYLRKLPEALRKAGMPEE
jgi:adenylate cyclase